MYAWHIVRTNYHTESGRLRVAVGVKARCKRAKLCRYGLHSSIDAAGAYIAWRDVSIHPIARVCFVEVSEPVERRGFKQVSLERTPIWISDPIYLNDPELEYLYSILCDDYENQFDENSVHINIAYTRGYITSEEYDYLDMLEENKAWDKVDRIAKDRMEQEFLKLAPKGWVDPRTHS